jgi:DNA-binding response OmpR family regulator
MILPKNIMIVEDEVITQRYLKEILEQYEVNVTGCIGNAEDAMSMLENTDINIDMILMDINIDGSMDGIQLARNILHSYTLPIVFISAYSDEETLEEVLELSPYGFITKPFSSKEVHVTLQIAYKRFLTYEARSDKKSDKAKEWVVLNENYAFDLKRKILFYKNEVIKLSVKQNTFIEILVKNLNYTVSYETLISKIWEESAIADSALRTLVYSLRKKLPDIPVCSHSKKGYYLTSI